MMKILTSYTIVFVGAGLGGSLRYALVAHPRNRQAPRVFGRRRLFLLCHQHDVQR